MDIQGIGPSFGRSLTRRPPDGSMHPHLLQRARQLNSKAPAPDSSGYVLCWLQQALRAEHNPIVEFAMAKGAAYNLPVVVYHGVDNRYTYASHRLHRFILEASVSLEQGIRARGVRFVRYVRRPDSLEQGLVYRLCERAACLVTDDEATYVAKEQTERVAQRVDIPVWAVDASLAVPRANFWETHHKTTKGFRAAHKALRAEHMEAFEPIEPVCAPYDEAWAWHDGVETTEEIDALIARCEVDMSLPPAPEFPGWRAHALGRLDDLEAFVLDTYKSHRNNPALAYSTSKLSPYLHFGVLDPREVVRRVEAAPVKPYKRSKYLDELLTWREYSHHRAYHAGYPASWVNLPVWALDTLIAHQYDPREDLYTLEELLHGETHDEVWNAAQKQFLIDGWMHNNLRMYWGKQIIKWCKTPKIAWATACYLNDRLSLDGRDPSTYGGLRWCFGESKRAWREQDVYGFVPTKSDGALRKRKGVLDWVAEQNARALEVEVPQPLDAVARKMGYWAG